MPDQLDPQVVALAKSIRDAETGNQPVSGASGEYQSRYQFMPDTWKAAAKQYLGNENAALTLQNENYVAYQKIKAWKDQGKNVGQIASLWNSGKEDPTGNVGVNKEGVAYDTPAYVQKVWNNYQKYKSETTQVAPIIPPKPQEDYLGGKITPPVSGTIQPPVKQGGVSALDVAKQYPSALLETAGRGLKTIGSALTQSEQGLGASVGDALATFSNAYKQAAQSQVALDDLNVKLGQKIVQLKKTGQDTSRLEKLYQSNTGRIFKPADIIPSIEKTPSQIAGEGLGTITDVAAAGTFGKGTGLLAKTAEGAGLGYGYDVSQKLKEGKTGVEALTPGAGTIIGATLPAVTNLAGSLIKKAAGKLSGAGENVVQLAIDNPDEVRKAMDQFAKNPEDKAQLVDQATEALQSFASQKNEEYSQALSNLKIETPVPADTHVSLFEDAVKKFNGTIDDKGELAFKNTSLTTSDQSKLQEAWKAIKGWSDFSPQGYDNLRQAVGNFMKEYKLTGNPRSSVVLGEMKTSLTNILKENIPGYSEMLSNYGDKAEAITDFAKEFQLGGRARDSTKLNNILKLMKKDPSVMQNFVKVFGEKGANEFKNQVAGAILSNWFNPSKLGQAAEAIGGAEIGMRALETGLKGGSTLAGAATLGLSSPRIVGGAATDIGRLGQLGLGTAALRLPVKLAK